MHLTDIDTVLVSHEYPDDISLEWSAGTIESWDASLVRVETDTGLVGWGEAGHALNGNEAVRGIVDAFESQVLGRDPANVRAICEDLYDRNLFWARGGLPRGVIGAIEIALYDVVGQALGVPVYRLLGGPTDDRVRVYGSGGIAATADARVEQARMYAERGFDIVKIRALADPMANVAFVRDTLEAIGPDASLAFDAVQGSAGDPWSVQAAIRLGRALEEFGDRLYWYEEPCHAENLEGYARVRDAVNLRVAGIESRTGRHEHAAVVDVGAVDVLHPDVTIAGGFAETQSISGYASCHGVPIGMHVWGTGISLLANLHYSVTDPNCEIVEYCQLPNPLRESMLPAGFEVEDGRATVPDKPGLGLDMPDDLAEEFPYRPGKGMVFD